MDGSDKSTSNVLSYVGVPEKHYKTAKIIIGVIVVIIIAWIIGYILLVLITNYMNSHNQPTPTPVPPIPSPQPNPLPIIVPPVILNKLLKKIIKIFPRPTWAYNYGQANGLSYTNINGNCSSASQSNAVGWFIFNNSNSAVQLLITQWYESPNCSPSTNSTNILGVIQPLTKISWHLSGSDTTGYKTLYTDSYFSIKINNTTYGLINPAEFNIKAGDVIKIYITNKNIYMHCNNITKTLAISS